MISPIGSEAEFKCVKSAWAVDISLMGFAGAVEEVLWAKFNEEKLRSSLEQCSWMKSIQTCLTVGPRRTSADIGKAAVILGLDVEAFHK